MKVHFKKEAGFLRSKIFLIIAVIFTLLVLVASGREIVRRLQIEREIEKLENEVERLETENTELRGLIEYFQTESYAERQAREKLNLQKGGERAVIISENVSEEVSLERARQEERKSNLKKWWDFFFAHPSF